MNKTALLSVLLLASIASAEPSQYFKIKVVDEKTGRGVPLVELKTTSEVKYITDSNGLVAFYEPGLMDKKVWFAISSHGYEFPADAFGSRGTTLDIKPDGSAELKIKRINIAERIYRITGEGIYRDTILLGEKAPIKQPLLNAEVTGQDSVIGVPYRGKIHWFWGDTDKLSYALGQFATSGATSEFPGKGGLDPNVGIDLNYFVDDKGFSRPMAPMHVPGVVWLGGISLVPDDKGEEKMVGHYTRLKDLGTKLAMGLVLYDDKEELFKEVKKLDLNNKIGPTGQSFVVKDGGKDYCYFTSPYAFVRVQRNLKDFFDVKKYEGFSPLAPGGRFAGTDTKLDRDKNGKLIYAWKPDTEPLEEKQQIELIKAGKMKAEEAWIDLKDAGTKKTVLAHGGSVNWNEYRKKWIFVFVEFGGTSLLGEVWFAEADKPEGPYRFAKKIATHNKVDLYNACHHAFFDQEGGRIIYFEGTYTHTFSGNTEQTPRYDYNQIMYRLDLGDERLKF